MTLPTIELAIFYAGAGVLIGALSALWIVDKVHKLLRNARSI